MNAAIDIRVLLAPPPSSLSAVRCTPVRGRSHIMSATEGGEGGSADADVSYFSYGE